LERTPRREKKMFEPMAHAKQSHVNSISALEAIATPTTTGSSVRRTGMGTKSPMKIIAKTTLKKGSSDLTTLTKEMEPAPRLSTVTSCPIPWIIPTGTSASSSLVSSFGGARRPSIQTGRTYRRPVPIWMAAVR
jgi:hypothetical protein